MALSIVQRFLKVDAAGGVLLFASAVLALIVANSPLLSWYTMTFQYPLRTTNHSIAFFINDGLMPLFFLLVGLELKREFLLGEFSEISKVILPGFAALGGMIVPALFYLLINHAHPVGIKGWAIPVATDIAFALGVLTMFGRYVPLSLKLFLAALAIFDDVGAIIIIAVFHTAAMNYQSSLLAIVILLIMWGLNRIGVRALSVYLVLGLFLWWFVMQAGIHPTLAGVLLAMMIPIKQVQRLELALHPWVAFVIMPLFAFVNMGLSFHGMSVSILSDSVTIGIILGLFLGKQIGVFGFSWLMIFLGWAKLPENTSWIELYGVALLCGIGFTMSLFLGNLAFHGAHTDYLVKVQLGVLLGSLLSGVFGAIVLFRKWMQG